MDIVTYALLKKNKLTQVNSYGDLPIEGTDGALYITKDTGQTYYWDNNSQTYIPTGTAGRTGVYSYSGDLSTVIGTDAILNQTNLNVLVEPTVPFSEGSEVVASNSVHGMIISHDSTTVTVKTITDMTIDSFKQVDSLNDLPETGFDNILYAIKDIDEFRTWDSVNNEWYAPAMVYTGVNNTQIHVSVNADREIEAELQNGSVAKTHLTQILQDDLDSLIVLPTYNSTTHKITFTTLGGNTYEIDLPMEDAVDSVTYNSSTKVITVHKIDGTSSTIDLSGLIDTYTGGENTETKVTIDDNKEITVVIKKIDASKIDYDNTSSSLTATNTQDAIDELKTAIDTAESDIDNLEDTKVDKVTGKQLSTEDFTTAFKTKLEGIEEGAEVNVNADWDANSGDAEILNKPTTIAGYGITDAYTKTEVDTKLTAVYKYKGSVNTYEDLPTTGQAVGDVYNVATKDTTHHIKAGDNVAWNGTQWDILAGDVDLTDYYTKTETNDLLDNKVDKVTGKQLSTEDYTTVEKTKLSGIEDNAEVNIIETVKVNGTALTPDQDRAVDITIAGDADHIDYDNTTSGLDATNVQDAIDELADEKVDKESGKGLSTNDFTDAYKNKLDDIEDNAEVNIIETIKVNGTALTPDTNRAVDITIAGDAANITYDNITSGLTADDVQEAIDELADEKVDKVTGKQLSTEDYTTAEKNKLADIEANADVNLIESISVNGTAQTITNKNVDIDVPTKTSDLTNDSNFIDNTVNDLVNYTTTSDLNNALDDKADVATTIAGYGITDAYTKTEIDNKISSVFTYKGSVVLYADLPTTGQKVGDVYNVQDADPTHHIKAGDNVAWTGSSWDPLGGEIDLSDYYTKTQADTLLADKVDKVTGKQLSTEDYTTVEKTKLAGIEDSADVNVIETVKVDNVVLTPDANKAVNIDLSGKVNEPATEGTDGQVLTTDGNGGRTWANAVSAIKDLSDVNLNTSTLAEGQILKYNATNDEWNNTDLDIATSSTLGVVQAGDGIDVDSNGVISVVARLEEIAELPTAAAALEGKIYLLTATQTGYNRGGIYMCEESTETAGTYEWKLISMSSLEAGKGITIEDDVISADTNIFPGTLDDWNALAPAEQAKYDFVASPDEASEVESWEDITSQINVVMETGSSYLQNFTVTPSYCYKCGKFMTFEARIQATAAETMPTAGFKSLRFFVQSDAFSTNTSMGATGALGWHTTQQTFTATGNIGTDGNADEHSVRCNILFKDNIEANYNVFIRWTQPIN